MAHGEIGAIVLSHVQADGGLEAGNVIIHLQSMVEKTAQISDPRPKRWNVILIAAQVSAFLFVT